MVASSTFRRCSPRTHVAASQSITHDVKGNMTSIPAVLRPGSDPLALGWDFDNRLTGADVENDSTDDDCKKPERPRALRSPTEAATRRAVAPRRGAGSIASRGTRRGAGDWSHPAVTKPTWLAGVVRRRTANEYDRRVASAGRRPSAPTSRTQFELTISHG